MRCFMNHLYGFFIAVLVLLFVAAPVTAQVTTVTLEGKILDTERKALPGATVSVKSTETGTVRGAAAEENGRYQILGIAPGTYSVQALLVGYQSVTRGGVQFVTGQRPVMDFVMTTAEVEMQVVETIGTRVEEFELRRVDVSTPVLRDQIANLPLNSRSVMNLAGIAPGIRSYAPSAGRSLPSAGSLPDLRFINFYVDGAEWKSMFNGNIVGIPQTGSPMPQDAVQEFRTIINPFDAEYTRGGAFIISAITARGTNEYHAEAFSFFRDKSLNARGPFERTKPDFDRQQVGLKVSGPLMIDKLFFLGSYELHNADDFIDVVPGRPAYNPGLWDRYAGTFEAPNKNHTGVIRLTYQQSNDHAFNYIWVARYLSSKTFFGGTVGEPGGIFGQYHINSHMLKHTWIISSNAFNEASVQYLRWRHLEPTISTGPALVYPSIRLGRGTFPVAVEEDHYRLINKFTTNIPDFYGPHVLKIGFDVASVSMTPWFPSFLNPEFTFATDTSSLPLTASIGVGLVNPLDANGIDATTDDQGTLVGVYIQDQWNPHPQWTFNLGVRYDAEINTLNNEQRLPWVDSTVFVNAVGSDWVNTGNRKNDLNNIAPRFSFNYDVFGTGRTVIRGGYGITFDRTAYFIAYFERRDALWRTYAFNNPGTLDPAVLRQRVAAGGVSAAPSINLLNNKMSTPQVHQFSIGGGHQITDELAASIDYVNMRARAVYATLNANYFKPSINRRVLSTSFGDVLLRGSFASAFTHAFLTHIVYRTSDVRLNLAYTLSWSFSDQDGLPTFADIASFRQQRSNGDERHRIVLSGIVNLPLGFQVSGLITVASPRPFDAFLGRDLNDNRIFEDDWLNGERNQLPDDSRIRNWYKTVDLRISKTFEFEPVKAELIFEAFNALNWFNATGYNGRMTDAAGNPLASFGKPSGAYAPRQMQLGVKVSY